MLLTNLEKFKDKKIDIFNIINIIIEKKYSFLIISVISILVSSLFFFSQKKLINAEIDIYLQSDNFMNEIINKKMIITQIESGNFITNNNTSLPTVGMETEKQLLTNLFINEVLFLTDLNSIFESDDTFKNLSIEEKNFLKQVKGLKFKYSPIIKGGESFKIKAYFSYIISITNFSSEMNSMENFLNKYLQYNISNVSSAYLNELIKLSKNLTKILERRYVRLNQQLIQYENITSDLKTSEIILDKLKTVMDLESKLAQIEELSIFTQSDFDSFNINLFLIDTDSFSIKKAYFELFPILLFMLILFNFIYFLIILLKVGYIQNQNIHK